MDQKESEASSIREVHSPNGGSEEGDQKVVGMKGGTAVDAEDMKRMGRVQELRRNFKFVGIVGFVTILQATWECTLLANWPGLLNG